MMLEPQQEEEEEEEAAGPEEQLAGSGQSVGHPNYLPCLTLSVSFISLFGQ